MFRDKLKRLINKNDEQQDEGNEKKKIENLVFFIVLLIITIVAINIIWNGNKDSNKKNIDTSSKTLAYDNSEILQNNQNIGNNDNIETRLEKILSKIAL